MKKIMPLVASIALILIAGIFASAGTMAWFSDTETVSVGDINAGTLDLTVNDENPCTRHITIDNIAPGWSERFCFTLKNIGSLDGVISVEISDIVNKENGVQEPEWSDDDEDGTSTGELGDKLIYRMDCPSGWGPVNEEGDMFGAWARTLNQLGGKTCYPNPGGGDQILIPGEEIVFKLSLRLDTDVGNCIQSDSVEFDIIFHLVQAP